METKVSTVCPISAGLTTLIGGWGRICHDKWELYGFSITMYCPNVLSITSTGMIAYSCVKCSNYCFHDFGFFANQSDHYIFCTTCSCQWVIIWFRRNKTRLEHVRYYWLSFIHSFIFIWQIHKLQHTKIKIQYIYKGKNTLQNEIRYNAKDSPRKP